MKFHEGNAALDIAPLQTLELAKRYAKNRTFTVTRDWGPVTFSGGVWQHEPVRDPVKLTCTLPQLTLSGGMPKGRPGGAAGVWGLRLGEHFAMSVFVYLLRSCKDGRFYIGQTDDLTRRLAQHNAGHVIQLLTNRQER